jgi:hypothetical protein
MGRELYVVLERDLPGLDTSFPNGTLGRAEPRLRGLCKELGVRDLSMFFSDDPDTMAELYESDYQSLEPSSDLSDLAPEQWFTASDGLETVRALIAKLKEDQDVVRGAQQIVEDLLHLEEILTEAEDNEIGWHLAAQY